MKKRPWTQLFVEGALIVGSILLAFGIEAWWDRVQDQRLEQAYVERLVLDLRGDSALWDDGAEPLAEKQNGLNAAEAWLRSPDLTPSARDKFLEDLTIGARFAYNLGIRAERTAFDELVSTGRLQLLSQDLREALL